MSAQHTPGPWTTGDNCRDDERMGVFIGGRLLASVYIPAERGDPNEPELVDKAMADARLIAASPRLLASLRALLDVMACYSEEQWASEQRAEARAAIAEAEGRGS